MKEKQNPETLLMEGQAVQFHPTGYSMYPFLNPDKGDQVIVEPLDKRKAKRGDVVLYRRGGEKGTVNEDGFEQGILVLHRIVKCSNGQYFMVGDNQSEVEGPLPEEQIKGIMTARLRNGRALSAKNPFYRLAAGLWLLVLPGRSRLKDIAHAVKIRLIRKP